MACSKRPVAYWVIVSFLALSTVLMLIAQTTPIFDYPLAVRLGFQNGADQISEFGVQVIRAFCVADTLVFIPLTVISLVGLLLRKRWSLFATASVTGISVYWVVAYGFMVAFLSGQPGYHVVLGAADWIIMGAYVLFGVWGLLYLILRGDRLVSTQDQAVIGYAKSGPSIKPALLFLLAICMTVFVASFFVAVSKDSAASYTLSIASFVCFVALYAAGVLGYKVGSSYISLEAKVTELQESVTALLKSIYVLTHPDTKIDGVSTEQYELLNRYLSPIEHIVVIRDVKASVDEDMRRANGGKNS